MFLILWTILSFFNDSIILPSPLLVFKSLLSILSNFQNYFSILISLGRVLLGLVLAFSLGIPLGIGVSLSKPLNRLVMPLIKVLQGTPIISWILLALIWFNLSLIPIFILFLNSFPILVISVYEGIKGIDIKIIEMSKFYKVNKKVMIKDIYVPSIISHLLASTTIILSSSFKIIVMAEIITKINKGIGSNINYAWINIETEKIFAWTIIVVIMSLFIETVINNKLKKKLGKYYA